MEFIHQPYIGRFAPSPTGLLHIGSLFTAVASFLDARAHNGQWLVRIEDLDPPREINGAAAAILRTLNAFGLEWDAEVVYQSQRHHHYQAALERLQQQNLVYPCFCSRKMVQHHAVRMGMDGAVYGGICAGLPLNRLPENDKLPAWRLRTPDAVIGFDDAIVGHYQQNLAHDIGDFILLRADGLWAYQLAVVVDDAAQGITHIVRGQDLLVSAPRQIYLQQCLNLPTPHYAHLPLLTNAQGQKWSKQTLAPILNIRQRENLLRQVFAYLRLPEAPEVNHIEDLLLWAVQHWQITNVSVGSINTEKSG
ncbi:tRNA glutamyl-Q(34) synthetase GluQRS [Stenoxybacter acetivorans]|uniref:tRNA glutamyl-Q(34) synthetase GluQRS n=1 Tax=Stenoxybacter acetivorans TaxID=422441 RepID=UPI000561E370|nr:tRNA glutamyl-Q(34) synthetase GluQRS [Stenoxybacter acetivorans]